MSRTAVAALFLVAAVLLPRHAAAESGAELYATNCASCHGAQAQGTNVAPPLIGRSAADVHLMLDTGRMPAAIPYANEIHKTPAFSEPEIDAIVGYVLSFSPHADRSLPKVTAGNVNHGRALFTENCAHCHGALGDGASVGYDNVAPSLMKASPFQIAEAVRAGPGVMPRFGDDVLSDRDVSDIASYVDLVRTQAAQPEGTDAGGLALAHVGPVAEGLIAWLVGIGLLGLFIRSIGTATTDTPPR